MSESAYADLVVDQGTDFAVQVMWTDQLNEPYRVVHPSRMQVRSVHGQLLLDLPTLSGADASAAPHLVYNTEGGVLQVVIPAAATAVLPLGKHYYDILVSYEVAASGFGAFAQTQAVRVAKVLYGTFTVVGRVTKGM